MLGSSSGRALPSLPADFVKTQIVGRFKAIPPTVLIFNVSYKCDSKCVMCNSWKLPYHDDLTTEEYRKTFRASCSAPSNTSASPAESPHYARTWSRSFAS